MFRTIDNPDFERTYGSIFREIFVTRDPQRPAFRHDQWKCVILPGPIDYLDSRHRRALIKMATSVGDEGLLLKALTPESDEPGQTVALDWYPSEEDRIRLENTGVTVEDCAAFGPSGRWGGLSMQSHDGVTWIGAEDGILASLVSAAGGAERIKRDFLEFADSAWFVSEELRKFVLGQLDHVADA